MHTTGPPHDKQPKPPPPPLLFCVPCCGCVPCRGCVPRRGCVPFRGCGHICGLLLCFSHSSAIGTSCPPLVYKRRPSRASPVTPLHGLSHSADIRGRQPWWQLPLHCLMPSAHTLCPLPQALPLAKHCPSALLPSFTSLLHMHDTCHAWSGFPMGNPDSCMGLGPTSLLLLSHLPTLATLAWITLH
jgi:hypothetical protein